ncbi:hypothetical protein OH460_07915 [Vibrio sp. Makdt]|uniref:hypothetical protein n=1 Tax=Vibrio sp. Makdt TaxID=2998828 RepID=UPI0022CD70E3|nr:hypothetical protein [Vibrio sp. Makdt]MDA0152223.1 hypothetical protein [Vibrio sp. Makdt]
MMYIIENCDPNMWQLLQFDEDDNADCWGHRINTKEDIQKFLSSRLLKFDHIAEHEMEYGLAVFIVCTQIGEYEGYGGETFILTFDYELQTFKVVFDEQMHLSTWLFDEIENVAMCFDEEVTSDRSRYPKFLK